MKRQLLLTLLFGCAGLLSTCNAVQKSIKSCNNMRTWIEVEVRDMSIHIEKKQVAHDGVVHVLSSASQFFFGDGSLEFSGRKGKDALPFFEAMEHFWELVWDAYDDPESIH